MALKSIFVIVIVIIVLLCGVESRRARNRQPKVPIRDDPELSPEKRPSESERVRLWKLKNTWPPQWQPESERFKKFMEHREAEIMAITGADERWENWLQYTQSRLVPKFTPFGFKLAQTPTAVHEKLRAAVESGVQNFDQLRSEGNIDVIYHNVSKQPKFVDLNTLAWEVINDLKTVHEEWAGGMKLIPTSAYGVRLYQNGSSLVMHYDRVRPYHYTTQHYTTIPISPPYLSIRFRHTLFHQSYTSLMNMTMTPIHGPSR